MKHIFIIAISALVLVTLARDTHAAERGKINWIYSMADYYGKIDSNERAQKPVYVDLYTDWCGWCKVMDQKTFTNDSVASFINTHFIPLKLNAETKEQFKWRGADFKYDDKYRVNTFTLYLTNGRLGFPTTVFIEPNGKHEAIPGYLQPRDIEMLLKFFALPNEKRDFATFSHDFVNKWKN